MEPNTVNPVIFGPYSQPPPAPPLPAGPSPRDPYEETRCNPLPGIHHEETPAAANVLQEADRLVSGARRTTYGSPQLNWRAITDVWNVFLRAKLRDHCVITPRDACMLMVLMKTIREGTGLPKRDNLIDIAGYARCAEIIADAESDE